MTAVALKDVSYAYGDGTKALEGISLDVGKGKRVAILGPNGAGKSTILKLMAGLIHPSAGNVAVFGKTGIVFQDPDDQIFMPRVWDDIAFGPINLELEKSEVERRVAEAMKAAGIEGFGDRVPHHLSHGEKKLVAIAGILAMGPEILLLDEPTANLDPKARSGILRFIDALDCTVVMATHDIEAAAEIADDVVILDGKILARGGAREMLANRKLLEGAGLEMPQIARLFSEMKSRSLDVEEIPLTVEEALEILAKRQLNSKV